MKSIHETITDVINNTDLEHIITQQNADDLIHELMVALEEAFGPDLDFVDRINRIAQEVSLPANFRIIIDRDKEVPFGRFYYQIECYRQDVITKQMGLGYGGKAYLSKHASDNELVQTIFGLYKSYYEHEARESFEWNDRRVFGPHIATQALWDVAKRIDVRNAKHTDDTPTAEESEEQKLNALRAKLNRPGPDVFGHPQ